MIEHKCALCTWRELQMSNLPSNPISDNAGRDSLAGIPAARTRHSAMRKRLVQVICERWIMGIPGSGAAALLLLLLHPHRQCRGGGRGRQRRGGGKIDRENDQVARQG